MSEPGGDAPRILYPDQDGVLQEHPVGLIEQTNEAYHAGPGISKSHLDAISSSSPLHYWHKYLNPEREPENRTPALIMGSAIHSAILEPDLFPLEYVESPGFDRRTKTGKAEHEAFIAQHAGKTVLDPDDYAKCLKIRDRVLLHPEVGDLFRGGRAEQSFFAYDHEDLIIDGETSEIIENGELIKCRFDYLHNSGELAVDVKTTDDASPAGFGKSIANYRYMLQPAWYYRVLETLYGEHPKTWVFVAVEKDPPYAVGYYFATPDQIERARIAALRDFARIVKFRRTNNWPDFASRDGLQPALLPPWAKV